MQQTLRMTVMRHQSFSVVRNSELGVVILYWSQLAAEGGSGLGW